MTISAATALPGSSRSPAPPATSSSTRASTRGTVTWQREQRQLASWIAQLPKPIGILAVHDDRGLQVLEACRTLDIAVPDEVAVLGIDNDEFLCNLAIPSLSSVDPNSERIGYEAAMLLDRMIDRRAQFTRPRYFPPVGVVARQSTDVLTAHDRDVTTAVRFIRQFACQRITVKDVERQVALSRSLLNRRFKQVVGRTPKAEIVRVQIETARQLLIDTDLPIAEIAALTGFSESKYFIAVFDRHVGTTPRSFRVKNGRFNGLERLKPPHARRPPVGCVGRDPESLQSCNPAAGFDYKSEPTLRPGFLAAGGFQI